MYNVFLFLHIICASMTIALMPFSIFMGKKTKRSKDTPAELYNIQTEFYISKTLGMIGGIGLLITGGGLAGVGHYPWFDFTGFPWLAWKQTFYILILAINFALMVPLAKKIMPMIAQRLSIGNVGATDEIRALATKASMFGMIMTLLTLINTWLGATKGGMQP